jgi:hypothetical protein
MDADSELESQIGQWRGYVERHRAISASDVDEMEDHLRNQISDLSAGGLHDDEAFLVAVKRMGNVNAISREFAREHSDRLWKQLVLMPDVPDSEGRHPKSELFVVLALALGAGMAFRIGSSALADHVFARNACLFVLPFLTGYFAWKRQITGRAVSALLLPFAVAAVVLNVYPFGFEGATETVAALHAPIALWFVVGFAYVGGEWRSGRRRMDFIRFTGEWVVYLVLLGLGGGVLAALTINAFGALGTDVEWVAKDWIVPFGIASAMVVAAWLVEAKQNVVENIAPVLTRVFTPLTTIMLLVLLAAFAMTGGIVDVDRNLLILMDVILVLVLGLLLYAISARDPYAAPNLFDRLQLVLVVSALAVDVLMLIAMLTRIAEWGFTPNKVAALGMNVVLLVNLVWSAWLLVGFLRGRRGFSAMEGWQTRYLPVFGIWAALVVAFLPPIFGYA